MTNIDYSKTIIYKIVCKNEDVKDVYVGSTVNFKRRITDHKKRCINDKYKDHNCKIYKIIRANGGWDNWSIIEIIKQSCKDSAEAHALERYYYELLNGNMNTNVPNRTKKQYQIDNADKIKQWRTNNADKIKQYQINNAEKIKQYKHEYYQKKKQHKAELQKINHEKYKEEKLLNYDYNAVRDETLKQMIELKI